MWVLNEKSVFFWIVLFACSIELPALANDTEVALEAGNLYQDPELDHNLNFKVLDKGKSKTLISLCIDGVRKISPTQWGSGGKLRIDGSFV